jgi:hypothetical protein
MAAKRIILVEDELVLQNEYSNVISRFNSQVELMERFRSQVEALEFIRSNRSRLDGVITDLRILSGPNQDFSPPVNTNFVYGVKLVEDMDAAGIAHIPVVAYSKYLGNIAGAASPTRREADAAKLQFRFLLEVLPTEPDSEAFVLRILNLFNRYWADLARK